MDFQPCFACGSSTGLHFCWVNRGFRMCHGRSNDYAHFNFGHLQSPICVNCFRGPAFIHCYNENRKLCVRCFANNPICISSRHMLHVIPFTSHVSCQAVPILMPVQAPGGGPGEGPSGGPGGGSDRRVRPRLSQVGDDTELRLGIAPPQSVQPRQALPGQRQASLVSEIWMEDNCTVVSNEGHMTDSIVGLGSVSVRNRGGQLLFRSHPRLSVIAGSDGTDAPLGLVSVGSRGGEIPIRTHPLLSISAGSGGIDAPLGLVSGGEILISMIDTDTPRGHVSIRNREEQLLYRIHPLLSIISIDTLGIPVLAYMPTQIQETVITCYLPEIRRKVTKKEKRSVLELNKYTGEALIAMIDTAKESLLRILVQGDFSEYPADQSMHCKARLVDMLCQLLDDLKADAKNGTEFLMAEIRVLKRCECEVIPRSAFMAVLAHYVDGIQTKLVDVVRGIWDYIGDVFASVISKYCETFPEIQGSIKQASQRLISKVKEQSVNRTIEILEMEKLTDYTCNTEYMKDWSRGTATSESFINAVLHNTENPGYFHLDGFGTRKISHLRKYQAHLLLQAFKIKMTITSYWTVVLQRIVDNIGVHLQVSVKYLVDSWFKSEIVAEMVDPRGGGGVAVRSKQSEEQYQAL